ncbi:MAG: 23S rRNA (cytosine1962-C5)-methyltransferase, partial [Parasphingorhabdus sp.]
MAETLPAPILMISDPRSDYALVDSGHGRKLERYG